MQQKLMTSSSRSNFRLDPRTKILLLVGINIIVVGGGIEGPALVVRSLAVLITFLLLMGEGKFKPAIGCFMLYLAAIAVEVLFVHVATGVAHVFSIVFSALAARIIPSLATGYYVLTTTTVSELVAALERMHVPRSIVIPLSVMFRFFPTVMEEYGSISDAMRMRGIRFGGKRSSRMIEYRFVPMMICSVKIGEELSAAALTRGLGAPVRRTNICEVGFHTLDIVLGFLCVGLLVANAALMIGT